MAKKSKDAPLKASDVKGAARVRAYSVPRLQPSLFLGRFVENPDEVLMKHGTWEGLGFYLRMLRQFAFLGGPINQRIDEVVHTDRQIVPGDPNDVTSLEMAKDARRVWDRVKGKQIILRKLLMGMFLGFSPVEKVWSQDTETGLLAPLGLYDIPPQNIKFGMEGEEYFLSQQRPMGELIPHRKVFYFRWGSMWTEYGEAELKDIYLATWYMQQIIRFGLEALEQLGRPLPVVYVPRTYVGAEADEAEAAIAAQYKFFVIMPTDELRVRVDFPGTNIAAGGNAGRSEQEWIRYLETWIYVRLLNTAQTGDRGGSGNGKLEEARKEMKNLKTAPASDHLDEVLTDGWLRDICEVNWGDQPEQLWPRFRSDVSEVVATGLNGLQASKATELLLRYTARQITAATATELITALGVPRTRATAMVESTESERSELVVTNDFTGDERVPQEEEAA